MTKWSQLRDQLGATLADSLQGLLDGAAADLQAYGNAVASDMVLAMSTGDEREMRHLRAQLKVLAGVHRLRLAQERDDLVWAVVNTAMQAALAGLSAAGAQTGATE